VRAIGPIWSIVCSIGKAPVYGRPFYIFGPYDDPRSVIRALERTVGRDNFDILAIGG
jgi:hypothetical protein